MNFADIPLKDIYYFLSSYNLSIKNNNPYLTVWNYILTHENIKLPLSIANWILEYNKLQKDLDPYNNLPEEVIIKILSELNCEQLSLTCETSKKIKSFCSNPSLMKEIFIKEGYDINVFDFKIMCKAIKLGTNRIISDTNNIKYILNTNGNIHILNKYENIILEDIKNIISIITDTGKVFVALDSTGNVYKITSSSKDKLSLKNIVQVSMYHEDIYCLDINSNLYKNDKVILKDVIKIITDKDISEVASMPVNDILFLTRKNEIYAVGENINRQLISDTNKSVKEIIKLDVPKNIKNIFNITSLIILITENEDIYYYGYRYRDKLSKIDMPKNIIKIVPTYKYFLILDNLGVLSKIYIFKNKIGNKLSNVKDFVINSKKDILIITNDNNLATVNKNLEIINETYVGSNSKLFNNQYLLINNDVYINEEDLSLYKLINI